MLVGGIATGGISIGVFLIPVRDWMVAHQILAAGDGVVIPFVDGIGFGWPQIVVAAGVIVLGALFEIVNLHGDRDVTSVGDHQRPPKGGQIRFA